MIELMTKWYDTNIKSELPKDTNNKQCVYLYGDEGVVMFTAYFNGENWIYRGMQDIIMKEPDCWANLPTEEEFE